MHSVQWQGQGTFQTLGVTLRKELLSTGGPVVVRAKSGLAAAVVAVRTHGLVLSSNSGFSQAGCGCEEHETWITISRATLFMDRM